MRVSLVPHAVEQMRERGISAEEVRATLAEPDAEYPVGRDRIRAERRFSGRRLAIKVVYNPGREDERVVVSVMRGRPTRR